MLTKLIITVLFFTLNLITFSKMTEYQDFSSECSTWFFKIDKEGKNTIFSDFYPPFDPSVKVENFSPIMEYNLDSNYYFNNQNNLMVELEDLKKIYAPYFSYSLEKDRLNIEFVRYDKEIIGNLGKRNTKLEYTKRVWNLSLDIKKSVGEIEYSQYEKFIGGRNKKFIEPTKILVRKRSTITLSNKDFEKSGDKLYISASKIMKYFDIKTIIQEGYLALQFDNIPRITTQTSNPPSAKNIWLSGGVERTDRNYTWADYMNDIIEGRRKSGWFWKGIYISEKDSFRDNDGKSIDLDINRIVPLAIYIYLVITLLKIVDWLLSYTEGQEMRMPLHIGWLKEISTWKNMLKNITISLPSLMVGHKIHCGCIDKLWYPLRNPMTWLWKISL